MSNHLMQTYARLPLSFTHGEGAYLFGQDGNRYLDAVSGIAVCALGHAHPKLAKALAQQAQRLIHVSNLFHIPEQENLGDRLCELSGMDTVFFSNSGAEANEAAIKLARLHGHRKGFTHPKIIVAEQSFHGRTLATLSATGNHKIQQGFEPLVEGFIHVPFNDIQALHQAADTETEIAAILIEPIQGEGGVNVPAPDYLAQVGQLAIEQDWLFMLDEVQTGIGRTGQWFAFQNQCRTPDVMTLAKGLGGGVPIGACLASGTAAELFHPGNHGSTFGGNPLACVAALTVLEVITEDQLIDRVAHLSQKIHQELSQALTPLPWVKEVRGAGYLIGIELTTACTHAVKLALKHHHFLLNVTANNVIRLMPPLILDESVAQEMTQMVIDIVQTLQPKQTTS